MHAYDVGEVWLDWLRRTWPGWRWAPFCLAVVVSALLFTPDTVRAAGPDPLPLGSRLLVEGDIPSFSLTGDGEDAVLLRWDYESPSPHLNIYLVPVDGSAPARRLNGEIGLYGASYFVAPDGQTILFHTSDSFQRTPHILYSVPISGGAPTALHPPSLTVMATSPQFTPDSQHVIFNATTTDEPSIPSPYIVPINGGEPVALTPSHPVFDRGNLTVDGEYLIYIAQKTLYSVSITGGPPTELFTPTEPSATFSGFIVSPDSTRVVFAINEVAHDLFELYSVPITGGEATRLSYPLALSTSYSYAPDAFTVTPDGANVVFQAIRTLSHPNELYRAPITGGELVALGLPLAREKVSSFQLADHLSPDSSPLLYMTRHVDTNEGNLYLTEVDDGATKQLDLFDNGESVSVRDGDFRLSHDGRYVSFLSETDAGAVEALYVVHVDGSPPIKIDFEDSMGDVRFSPDSSHVAFRAFSNGGRGALCLAAVDGGALHCSSAISAGTRSYEFLPGGRVIFSDRNGLHVSVEITHTTHAPAVWSSQPSSAGSLLNVLQAEGRFFTLIEALNAAGLAEPLASAGPLTILAPTDDAFAALPPGALDQLLANPSGQLRQILLFHMLPGSLRTADIDNGMEVTTQQGKVVNFEVDGGPIRVNGAHILYPDLEATNGVIHGINAVILPPPD